MEQSADKVSVLFVCTGNICRSPSADGVFRSMVDKAGLSGRIHVDSAGTEGYHVGAPPDERSQAAAKTRGYDISGLSARLLSADDFTAFDYVLAMDNGHFYAMTTHCPSQHCDKIELFLDYANEFDEEDVPDPYYGDGDGFEHVLDLVEDGCRGLLNHIQDEHHLD